MSACCPSCTEPLLAEDVNIQTALGQCRQCNAVFNLVEHMTPEVRRREVPLPQSIRIDNAGGELRLTRRWYSWVAWLLLIFSIFWNGAMALWYVVAWQTNAPMIAFLLPILPVLAGVGVIYLTLALFLNRTVVRVGSGLLTIHHGPIPWYGNRTLEVAEVDQFYCTQHTVRRRSSNGSGYHIHIYYRLNALLEDRRKVILMENFHKPEQALFVEQQLEDHLQITDRLVAGELPR